MFLSRLTKSTSATCTYLALGLLFTSPCATAATPGWLSSSVIRGYLSAYNWTSINHYFSGYNQYTLSIGGGLYFRTPYYEGFAAAVEPVFQSGHAIHQSNPNLVSPTLGPSLIALAQAYLKYDNYGLNVKAGDMQLNTTPWDSSGALPWTGMWSGYRVVPQTYEGINIKYKINKNIELYFARIFRFRYYTQAHYHSTSEYLFKNNKTSGFMYAGITYHGQLGFSEVHSNSELWYYDYYQFARQYLLQSVNTIKIAHNNNLIFGLQFMDENKNNGYLGNVDSQVYGIKTGFQHGPFELSIAGDYLPAHIFSYGYGSLVEPYNINTSSGPFFSAPWDSAVEDFGSGTSETLKFDYNPSKVFWMQLRYTNVHMRNTTHYNSYNEYDLITEYEVPHVKGLLLDSRLVYASQPSQTYPNFYQIRLLATYKF